LRTLLLQYVAREWMLVDAYVAAAKGDFSKVHQLHALLQQPYAEQTADDEAAFYRRNFDAGASWGVGWRITRKGPFTQLFVISRKLAVTFSVGRVRAFVHACVIADRA
jgi:hypothetical protein